MSARAEKTVGICACAVRVQMPSELAAASGVERLGRASYGISDQQTEGSWEARHVTGRGGYLCSGIDRRKVVGAIGFEPTTSRSRTERSTKLSHAPNVSV